MVKGKSLGEIVGRHYFGIGQVVEFLHKGEPVLIMEKTKEFEEKRPEDLVYIATARKEGAFTRVPKKELKRLEKRLEGGKLR